MSVVPESITLTFVTSNGGPVLCQSELVAGERRAMAEPGGERPLKWGRQGLRVLALALVRLARWQRVPMGETTVPLLVGQGRPSLTATIGDLLSKAKDVGWLTDMLSLELDADGRPAPADAVARLHRWFAFGNSQGRRRDQPMTVNAVATELPPEAVTIRLDGKVVSGAVLDRLERELSAELDGSLPPLINGAAFTVAGYLPSTGSACRDRDDTLEMLDVLHAAPDLRILVLVGAGGSGKTTVAREWLGRRIMAGQVRQPLVFGWSFYRQGYGASGGQLLAEFYDRLAAALGVEIHDGMLPVEVAEVLVLAMRDKPVLLFLDGIEALVDPKCELIGGITDAALAELLQRLGAAQEPTGSWVLITSRRALKEVAGWSYPEVQHLKLPPLLADSTLADAALNRESTALEWTLAGVHERGREAAAALLAKIAAQDTSTDDVVPGLVRRTLESLGESPEWALTLLLSLFDRPPEWSAVQYLIRSTPALPRLVERWQELPIEAWEEVVSRLQELKLVQMDAENRVVIHPRIAECLATEFRSSLPLIWVDAHRRLCIYFAEQPKDYLPNTILEMEPLFRATWHGCQAGDYRHVHDTILFPRVTRGNAGYPIFELGAYQAGLHLTGCLTHDHLTFPPGCDLRPDDRALVIHCAGLCMRFMDRLDEAYAREKAAWARTFEPGCTFASVGPVGIHLLRCQHIFGDLEESGAVLRRLTGSLIRAPMSPRALRVSPSFMADALGIIGSIVATVLWARGHHWVAKKALNLMMRRINKLLGQNLLLAPGVGGPWHALVLLDAGDWQTVEAGIKAGNLDHCAKRNRETGMIQLIHGRLAAAKVKTAKDAMERDHFCTLALAHLHEGLTLVQRNRLRWWQATFHLTLAQHYEVMGRMQRASASAVMCLDLARQGKFRLLERDATDMLARMALEGNADKTAEEGTGPGLG